VGLGRSRRGSMELLSAPPTPLCTEARPPSRALRFPLLTPKLTSTCPHAHANAHANVDGRCACTCACKCAHVHVHAHAHAHVTCDVCAHVSENGGLGFEVVTRVANSTSQGWVWPGFFSSSHRFLLYFSRARVDVILICFPPAYIYRASLQPSDSRGLGNPR